MALPTRVEAFGRVQTIRQQGGVQEAVARGVRAPHDIYSGCGTSPTTYDDPIYIRYIVCFWRDSRPHERCQRGVRSHELPAPQPENFLGHVPSLMAYNETGPRIGDHRVRGSDVSPMPFQYVEAGLADDPPCPRHARLGSGSGRTVRPEATRMGAYTGQRGGNLDPGRHAAREGWVRAGS